MSDMPTATNSTTTAALPSKQNGQPDWLTYQRLFETLGGVDGYLMLRQKDPAMFSKVLTAFHVSLSRDNAPVD